VLRQVTIEEFRQQNLVEDRLERAHAEQVFALRIERGAEADFRNRFRLHHRRHRTWLSRHARARPVELRRIHRRQFDHGYRVRAVVVIELGAKRIGKPTQRVLGAAIGGLQRNAAIGQSGADLNNSARDCAPAYGGAPPWFHAPC